MLTRPTEFPPEFLANAIADRAEACGQRIAEYLADEAMRISAARLDCAVQESLEKQREAEIIDIAMARLP
jgi:hypothetical protein